jgi:hypothetical protein
LSAERSPQALVSFHLVGIVDEAQTQCYAVHWSREYHDGGRWDLRPASSVWP